MQFHCTEGKIDASAHSSMCSIVMFVKYPLTSKIDAKNCNRNF